MILLAEPDAAMLASESRSASRSEISVQGFAAGRDLWRQIHGFAQGCIHAAQDGYHFLAHDVGSLVHDERHFPD